MLEMCRDLSRCMWRQAPVWQRSVETAEFDNFRLTNRYLSVILFTEMEAEIP